MGGESDRRPLLAVTMGDPAGIGPEIVLKALRHPEVLATARPLVVGDQRILRRAAEWVGWPDVRFQPVQDPSEARFEPGVVSVLDQENADPDACSPGEISAKAGRAAVEYVLAAADLALAGAVDAMVTAPLNKAAMNAAGYHFAGHTELLAERTNTPNVKMLLVGPKLRVIHVSTHLSLVDAIRRITADNVLAAIGLAQESMQALGIERPRIAVAGLNPHASEGGLFGDEEARSVIPAIEQARARGYDVSEPQPPDTVFLRAVNGAYDVVVAMYHDQGHIPMKLLAFDSGVNVSIGLPIIRTSVDHGTAFDIAGTGVAREASLLSAMEVAVQMVEARRRSQSTAA